MKRLWIVRHCCQCPIKTARGENIIPRAAEARANIGPGPASLDGVAAGFGQGQGREMVLNRAGHVADIGHQQAAGRQCPLLGVGVAQRIRPAVRSQSIGNPDVGAGARIEPAAKSKATRDQRLQCHRRNVAVVAVMQRKSLTAHRTHVASRERALGRIEPRRHAQDF